MKKKLNAYLVGGAVRDRLLGRPVQDRDWVVVGSSPREMKKRGFKPVGKDFPVFLHPKTKEEYALARTERKQGSGHRGFVVDANPHVTLEEDLSRRDLTINAIAQSVEGELVDPFGGVRDAEARVLRHVSDAFVEDPLRVFRVARFAAELEGFEVAPETLALMAEISASGELETLAAERIWQEFQKALAAPRPQAFLDVLEACGALSGWAPELVGIEPEFTPGDAVDRFSELPLDEEALLALTLRLKTPRRFRVAALNHLRWGGIVAAWRTCDVADLDEALMALKVLHELEPLERLLGLLARHGHPQAAELVPIAAGLRNVSVDGDLTGPALGDALREARIDWLAAQRER